MPLLSSSKRKRGNEDSSDRNPKRTKDVEFLIDQKNKEIKELKRQVKKQDKDIDILNERIKELEEEVKVLNEELTETRKELREVKESVVSLQGDHNILLIGEMCRRLQANLYQCVFPEMEVYQHYSYKIKNLEEKIKNAEAKKQWEELKRKENVKRFQGLIEELQNLRNTKAHPDTQKEIGLQTMEKAAEELNKQKGFSEFLKLHGFCFDDVKEVIKIWNRTENYVKKLKA